MKKDCFVKPDDFFGVYISEGHEMNVPMRSADWCEMNKERNKNRRRVAGEAVIGGNQTFAGTAKCVRNLHKSDTV